MIKNIDYKKCIGCGICVDRCPLDTLRLNIFVKEVPPCQEACPAGVDVRGYIYLIKQGKFRDAINLVRESLPFPAITGRICYHPCESKCARKDIDDSVNINSLERFIGDYWICERAEAFPRLYAGKVAIVGSGPTGLSVAYFLTRIGYKTTIFEARREIGGSLRSLIEKLLPIDIFEAQISYIKDMGVEFETGIIIGKDLKFSELRESGYKVIFLGIGKQTKEIHFILEELKIDDEEAFKVNSFTLQTSVPYVFAGGSLIMGRVPIVKIISAAKKAAIFIDRYMKGEDLKVEKVRRMQKVKIFPKEGIEKKTRIEVITGFSEEIAMEEAQRCMKCGSKAYIAYPDDCMTCFECEVNCPSGAVDVHPFKEKLPSTI
jgi:NADPH-dependent glutamate synthase beta subunit-like oxidoreductase